MHVKCTWVNLLLCCVYLTSLLVLSACQSKQFAESQPQISALVSTPDSTAANTRQAPSYKLAATLLSAAMSSNEPAASSAHPVLAFYYPWYNTSTWNPATMSDLPATTYNSSDDMT